MDRDDPMPSPNPVDTPLREITDRLDASADSQFQVIPGGDVRCLKCGATLPGDGVDVSEMTRLEGASDPADMSMVVPLTCSSCGARGSLVVAYGPQAGAAETDLLLRSRRRRKPTHPTRGARR